MIGIKDQCFGVEVEMTGLTRKAAAQALAEYFGTAPHYHGGVYDSWSIQDPEGKTWKIMSDSSIRSEQKTASGYVGTSNSEYRVEMVTPKLTLSCQNFKSASAKCGEPAARSTTPAAFMSTWTPPITTARA